MTFEIRNIPADDPDAILHRLKTAQRPVINAARQRALQADIILDVTNSYPGLETPLDH